MPSDKILQEKQAIVAALADEFKSAQTLVVASSRGLTVAEDTELRNTMRAEGITYKVVKNTLALRAAEVAGIEGLEEVFKGPTAIAYSTEDVIAPAKITKKFAKQFEEFEVKGGFTDGKVMSLEKLEKLASTPDLPTLYTQLVFTLNFPIQSLAMVLNQVKEKAEEAGVGTVQDLLTGEAKAADATPAEETAVEEVAPETAEASVEEAPAASDEASADETPAAE